MRILMLAWEYPPHLKSGLGKACEGLARGLAEVGFEVTVVLPRVSGEESAAHVRVISLEAGRDMTETLRQMEDRTHDWPKAHPMAKPAFALQEARQEGLLQTPKPASHHYFGRQTSYGPESLEAVMRYAERTQVLNGLAFDRIHCHDWLTLPGGLKLKAATGKPLVFHVHSLEGERAGDGAHNLIDEIERRGLHEADHIVTISHQGKRHLMSDYHVPEEKISVVHNGVSRKEGREVYGIPKPKTDEKTVLFTGPFIFRKGPEYFVDAAAKVLEHERNVRFVMSGSGEKLDATLRKVTEWRLGDRFQFPGFLDGLALERVFLEADLYVMPSVDDPFGFAPLEAVVCDTPVIISKQSGASEILRHALQVDFWDVNRLAEYMLAILTYEPLSRDMVAMAQRELQQLHWRASAEAFGEIYHRWDAG